MLETEKVSAITWARISGVRRFRREEMDLKALNENLASNRATARSRRAKLLLISITEDNMLGYYMHEFI